MKVIFLTMHLQFCLKVEEIKKRYSLNEEDLNLLEKQLATNWEEYQVRRNDLRQVTLEYQIQQQKIKSCIRQLVKSKSKLQR